MWGLVPKKLPQFYRILRTHILNALELFVLILCLFYGTLGFCARFCPLKVFSATDFEKEETIYRIIQFVLNTIKKASLLCLSLSLSCSRASFRSFRSSQAPLGEERGRGEEDEGEGGR